jgi:hypothetical protein
MKEALLKTHYFCFNTDTNSGEGITLTTKFFANGDKITQEKGVFVNQELRLQSYCNDAVLNLVGCNLTPAILRQLANELESERIKLVKK